MWWFCVLVRRWLPVFFSVSPPRSKAKQSKEQHRVQANTVAKRSRLTTFYIWPVAK